MKPQAFEALQKAKALFRHPAEVEQDEIPEQITQAPEPIRKPRVVLLPPNAPKFDAQSMKEEQKQMSQPKQPTPIQPVKQIDKYVGMSTNGAVADCIKMGITKPSEIAKLTGKKVEQIYTSLWNIRKGNIKKFKKVAKKMPAPYASIRKPEEAQQVEAKDFKNIKPLSDDFDREPTAWEDAHRVVFKSREEYEAELDRLHLRISDLLIEKQEQATIIKYLERKANG
jgi:hypothetical protein